MRALYFWESWRFFYNMGMRAVCFSENWRFCHNMGIRAVGFSLQIGKKKRTIYVFDHIWSWQQGVFHEKSEKKDLRALCFWKNGRFFWQNVGIRGAFFRKWTFFDKMWAWEQYFFREKSEKKGILLTFLPHNIVYFLQIWRFCD